MDLLSWIIIGAVIGLVAGYFDDRPLSEVPKDIIMGTVGAVAGGLIASLVFKINPLSMIGIHQQPFLTALLIALAILVMTRPFVKEV